MGGLGRRDDWTAKYTHYTHVSFQICVGRGLCHMGAGPIYRHADEKFLPMLSYILKHGNVSVYEWKHGKPPPEVRRRWVWLYHALPSSPAPGTVCAYLF